MKIKCFYERIKISKSGFENTLKLNSHVKNCKDCKKYFEELVQTEQLLESTTGKITEPDKVKWAEFNKSLNRKIDSIEEENAGRSFILKPAWKIIPIAVAATVILIIGTLIFRREAKLDKEHGTVILNIAEQSLAYNDVELDFNSIEIMVQDYSDISSEYNITKNGII